MSLSFVLFPSLFIFLKFQMSKFHKFHKFQSFCLLILFLIYSWFLSLGIIRQVLDCPFSYFVSFLKVSIFELWLYQKEKVKSKLKNKNKPDAQLTCLHMERREAKRRKGLLYGLRRPCLWDNTKTMHIRFSTSLSHSHSLLWLLLLIFFFFSFVYIYILHIFCLPSAQSTIAIFLKTKKKKMQSGPSFILDTQ